MTLGDKGLCDVCRGTGYRSKRVGDDTAYSRVRCYACHGTGKWHRSDERWPYATTANPDRLGPRR